MASGLLAQYAVVALAVGLSAAYLVQRQWPGAVRRLRIRLALWLLREGNATPARRLGRLIAPPPSTTDAACGSCNGCNPAR